MKIKPRRFKKEDRINYLDTLYTAVSSLKDKEEIKKFLRDVLTESERIMIGRRILIAKMLLENKTYNEIINEMHVGMDTIMRVHRWLEDESDGYENAIKGLERELGLRKNRNKRKEFEDDRFSFGWLRKRYPIHFLLFNLIDKKLNGRK